MKYILLFLILLPYVNAIAITPTSLNFETEDKQELLIINNLDSTINIKLTTDCEIKFSENDFKLNKAESKLIIIKPKANCNDLIYVNEISNSNNLNIINSIAIPITSNKEVKFTNLDTIKVSPITGQATGVKVSQDIKLYYALCLIPLIILIIYIKKNLKTIKNYDFKVWFNSKKFKRNGKKNGKTKKSLSQKSIKRKKNS